MDCKCGGVFEINPPTVDPKNKNDPATKARTAEVATKTLSVIDAKKNHALVVIVECPFCHAIRAMKIGYHQLLDLPNQGSPAAFSTNDPGPSAGERKEPRDGRTPRSGRRKRP